eukprot:scaffold10530_cov96-Isochrysis_galbana.AAC.4
MFIRNAHFYAQQSGSCIPDGCHPARPVRTRRAGRPIVYVNTWSHLFGHKNNNAHMALVRSRPAAGSAVADDSAVDL